ncbi:MAG: hypothetical protein LBP53_05655 [Candidatus Peribacteria bacterium]|jgi:tRNA pseudouridine55 synthase|nr:hypothetical protein [Candidatus Peribacteria bacterium]
MLIAVDKPLELTSFDVVKRMNHLFPGEKIGHSGTLDPKATGLMILGIGKGTKKLTSLIGLDKVYETTIDFSKMSDTWDMGYWEKYEEYPVSSSPLGVEIPLSRNTARLSPLSGGDTTKCILAPSLQEMQETLSLLMPERELPLPAFSAKKKEGKRLYALARSGQEISESRVMKVHHVEILDYAFPQISLRLLVGS